MRIAAYQFDVCGDVKENLCKMLRGVELAAEEGADLLVFPECALSGYPPKSIPSSGEVDFDGLDCAMCALKDAALHRMCLVYGSVTREDGRYYNSAVAQLPDGSRHVYHKRALWGWDCGNFAAGGDDGMFELSGWKAGVRICYEVRFPEYFRELYRAGTDLNLILFYDTADAPDRERLEIIRSHVRTRAAENVTPCLTVNACRPFQTAPTGLYDGSGRVLAELPCGEERLLVYELKRTAPNFSERGRRQISDGLAGGTA